MNISGLISLSDLTKTFDYQCSLCPCVFDKITGLDEHFSRVHDGKKPETQENFPPAKKREETEIEKLVNVPNRCAICFRVLRTKRNLERHHAMVHKEKQTKTEYNCNLCGYSCFKENTLSDHIAAVHLGEKPHECSECSAKFLLNSQLSLHVRTVHEGKKPHKCSECDTRFSKKDDLYLHISSVHEGGKSIKCSLCDFRFFRIGYLQRHIASVHEGEKPPKATRKMSIASSNFRYSENGVIEPIEEINVQMVVVKKEHGEELNCGSNVTEVDHPKVLIHEIQPCQCPICDTIFSSKAALERHLDEMMVQPPHLKSG
jgi:uncharacterized Zn-finger protein